ncbi:MAG: LysM peptidoglycan-binding domain-containing protein [Puniceicoccales bacterium]|nr:LysM peptidoglycan-binding domain-containing protein [Puniceicoccales bacterium]
MMYVFFLFILPLVGCSSGDEPQQRAQISDPIFRKGRIQLQRGNDEAALRCFEKIIQLNPKQCAEAHLESGEIFLNHRKDPISAIYHYREYLAQMPNSRQSPLVRQRINTAEKAYLSQIPPLRHMIGGDPSDLLHSLKLLQDENSRLRRQLVALQTGGNRAAHDEKLPPGDPLSGSGVRKESPKTRHYTVVRGDTLSSISQKVYGTPTRWKDIFTANRQSLPSPSQLTIGQVLDVPE